MKRTGLFLAVSASLSLAALKADIVYDNSTNYEGKFNSSALESGDQVNLAGDARLLTGYAFEYFARFSVTGDESARVRFYYNDGPEKDGLKEPGTVFYDSGPFTISSGFKTIRGEGLDLLLDADSFTFTIEFGGLAATEQAGLLYYNPPTVGTSGAFFWQKSGSLWEAVATGDTGNNFVAQFVAERVLQISRLARQGEGVSITASVTSGKGYALEFSRLLGSNDWQRTSGGLVRAASNQLTMTDAEAGSDPARFYRLVEKNTSIRRSNGQATIVSFSTSGRRYALESSSNLSSWTRLSDSSATGDTVAFNVLLEGEAPKFFRVVEL